MKTTVPRDGHRLRPHDSKALMIAGAESVPFGAGVTMQVLLFIGEKVAEENGMRKRERNDKR